MTQSIISPIAATYEFQIKIVNLVYLIFFYHKWYLDSNIHAADTPGGILHTHPWLFYLELDIAQILVRNTH